MYDIAIIGLGPAGATVARLLNKKYKVLALDRKTENMAKCCGGLLSPDAQKILASFDLCLPKDVLVDPQIFSVRTIDFDNNLERYYQRFYLNMDRGKFDKWLVSLIPDNVTIINEAICKKVEKIDDGYRIHYMQGTKRFEETAKVVIGADGANSVIRNMLYPQNNIIRYVSIQEWYENEEESPIYTSIFDRKLGKSYSWTISKNQYFVVGGAFPEESCNENFEELKTKLRKMGYKFSKNKLVKREGCFVYLSNAFNSVHIGKDNIYLIGEAAGMISPSSLEGISYAMDSGHILAEVLNKKLLNSNRVFFKKTLKLRTKLKLKIIKRPFMYNKFLRKLVMKSGLQAIRKA